MYILYSGAMEVKALLLVADAETAAVPCFSGEGHHGWKARRWVPASARRDCDSGKAVASSLVSMRMFFGEMAVLGLVTRLDPSLASCQFGVCIAECAILVHVETGLIR